MHLQLHTPAPAEMPTGIEAIIAVEDTDLDAYCILSEPLIRLVDSIGWELIHETLDALAAAARG